MGVNCKSADLKASSAVNYSKSQAKSIHHIFSFNKSSNMFLSYLRIAALHRLSVLCSSAPVLVFKARVAGDTRQIALASHIPSLHPLSGPASWGSQWRVSSSERSDAADAP